MNEEKPFLGFSSFRAEPERKLSRRRFRLPPATSGYPDRERHRILYVQKPGRKIIESLQMALHPEICRQERLVRRGRRRSHQRLKGGERGAVPPASFFGDDPAQRLDRTSAAARLSSPQETNHALQSGTKPVLQSDSELFVMIGLVADNRKGPVKLLGEKGAHDLMGKGHSRKRQPTVGPLVHFR